MIFKCPHCSSRNEVDQTSDGQSVRCSNCDTVYALDNAGPDGTENTFGTGVTEKSDHSIGRLGRFEIREVIGQGGFGRVYRAYDPHLDRSIALKVPTFAKSDTQRVARFLAEAKAAAQLRHPGIVPVHDCGNIDGRQFIASQFISGRPLSRHVDSSSRNFRQIARWIRDIARALAYAHRQGVVHRDVKSDNIMIDDHDNPQVMDFGLAKREADDSGLTTDGSVLGTPAYMSPEQARGETEQVGSASDQYSLGVVLYELLAKQRPFTGHPTLVVARVRNDEPVAPSRHASDIPKDLETICQKAMNKESEQRYTSCDAFADDLDRWLSDEPINARRVGTPERFLRWCRRNPKIASLSGMIALTMVSSLLVFGFLSVRLSSVNEELAGEVLRASTTAVRADNEAKRADKEAKRAVSNEKLAEARADEAEHHLYIAHMNLVQTALREGRVESARKLLDECQSAGAEFEIGFLKRVCDRALYRVEGIGWQSNVNFSPKGDLVAAAGKGLYVFDVLSGEELLHIETDGSLSALAFSPDGQRLAYGTLRSNKVLEIAPRSGQSLGAFETRGRGTQDIDYSPDGSMLLSTGNGLISLFERESRTRLKEIFLNHDGSIDYSRLRPTVAVFSPNSRQIATIYGHPRLWDVESGMEVDVDLPRRQDRFFLDIAFSPNGQLLALASGDGMLTCWDINKKQSSSSIHAHQGAVSSIAFLPDGMRLVSAGSDAAIRLWELPDGKELAEFHGHKRLVADVAASSDGTRLASVGQSLCVWDANDLQIELSMGSVGSLFGPNAGPVSGPIFGFIGGSGSVRVVAASNYHLHVFDLASGQELFNWKAHDHFIRCLALSPDRPEAISVSRNGEAFLWNLDSREKLVSFRTPKDSFTKFVFGTGGRVASVARGDEFARIWDVASGEEKFRNRHIEPPIDYLEIAFSSDGTRLAAAGNREIQIWNSDTGEQLATFNQQTPPFMQFKRDGRSLLAGNVLRDTGSGDVLQQLKSLNENQKIAVSPSGNRIATSEGRAFNLIDLTSQASVLEIKDGQGEVVFSDDGLLLAKLSRGSMIKVWDSRPLTAQLRTEKRTRGLLHRMAISVPNRIEAERLIRKHYVLTPSVRQKALSWIDLFYPPWPASDERGRIEGESLFRVSLDGLAAVQEMALFENGPWSGDAQLFWRNGKLNSKLILGFEVETEGRYALGAVFTKAPDFVAIRISLDGVPISDEIDLNDPAVTRTDLLPLGEHDLINGRHQLAIEIVSVSEPASEVRGVGLDYLSLTK